MADCKEETRDKHSANCCAEASASTDSLPQATIAGDDIRTAIRIIQMDCPTEEALIRKALEGVSSVTSLEFDLMQSVLTVVHAPNGLVTVLDVLRSLNFEGELVDASGEFGAAKSRKSHGGPWPRPEYLRSHPRR